MELCSSQKPKDEEIVLSEYATVEEIHFIRDVDKLAQLREFHILADETLLNRFYYRSPGIYAVIVRVYHMEESMIIPNDESYEGCKSWIEFPESVSSQKAQPVLDDESYSTFLAKFQKSLLGNSDP